MSFPLGFFKDYSSATTVYTDDEFLDDLTRRDIFEEVYPLPSRDRPVFWHTYTSEDIPVSATSKAKLACTLLRGVDSTGEKVAMIIRDIRPFFYVSIPDGYSRRDFVSLLTEDLPGFHAKDMTTKIEKFYHYHGFQLEKSRYLRVETSTLSARGAIIKIVEGLAKKRTDIFFGEADKSSNYVSMYLRHNTHIPINGWSLIPRKTETTDLYFREGVYSRVWIVDEYIFPDYTSSISDPCLVNAWDIETKKLGNDMIAPRPLENADESNFFYISAISCSISMWATKDPRLALVFTHLEVKESDFNVDGKKPPVIIVSKTEEDMILAYYRFLSIIRPEYESAFNGGRFDWPVMFCKVDEFSSGSKINIDEPCTVKDWMMNAYYDAASPTWGFTEEGGIASSFEAVYKRFTSPVSLKMEAGINEKFIIPSFPGVTSFDTMVPLVKAYSNIEDKRLDTFLQRANLGSKEDMDYIEMHRLIAAAELFEDGAVPDRVFTTDENGARKIIEYPLFPKKIRPRKTIPGHRDGICKFLFYSYIDSVKLGYLIHKEGIIITRRAIAALGRFSMQAAFSRPDGAVLMNMMAQHAYADGRVMHNGYKKSSEMKTIKYFGAYVVPPVHGLHNDRPVTGIDFSSLYPSLMMTFNLSPDMIVNESDVEDLREAGYNIRKMDIPYRLKVGSQLDDPNISSDITEDDVPEYILDDGDDDDDDEAPVTTRKAADEYELKSFTTYVLQHNGIHDPAKDKRIITKTLKSMRWRVVLERDAVTGKPSKYGKEFVLPAVEMADTVDAHKMANEMLGNETYDLDVEHTFEVYHEYGRKALPNECMGVNARLAQYLFNLRKAVKKPFEAVGALLEYLDANDLTEGRWDREKGISTETAPFVSIIELREIREKLNYQQLAIKILANSIYGKSGQEALFMFSISVAAGITFVGQMFATRPTKEFVTDEMGCDVVYGDTDSLYIKCPEWLYASIYKEYARLREESFGIPKDVSFYKHSTQLSQAEVDLKVKHLWTPMVIQTRKYIPIITDTIADRLCASNGTRFLAMASEENGFPTYLGGKKKYTLVPHEKEINFFPKKFFIRGFDFKKRGASAVSRKIGDRLIREVLHPGFHGDTMRLVMDVLKTFTDNKNVADFIIYGTYRPSKKSTATNIRNTFYKRHEEAKKNGDGYMALKYSPALPGETFPFILVNKNNGWTVNGKRSREDKVSNLVEPYELVRENADLFEVNHLQYIMKMKGFLSRFIIADERFKEDESIPSRDDFEEEDDHLDAVDKHLAKRASKFIVDTYRNICGYTKIQESSVMARKISRRLDDDELCSEIVTYLERSSLSGRSRILDAALIAAVEDYMNDGYEILTVVADRRIADAKTTRDVKDYYTPRFERYQRMMDGCFEGIFRSPIKTSNEELAKGIVMMYLCGDYIVHRDRVAMMYFVRLIRLIKARDYEKAEKEHVLEKMRTKLSVTIASVNRYVDDRREEPTDVAMVIDGYESALRGLY